MLLSRANKLNTTFLQRAIQRGYATYMDVEQAEWKDRRFFITGANGQLGRMIVKQLCNELGADRVVASDLGEMRFDFPCKYETLDVTDG